MPEPSEFQRRSRTFEQHYLGGPKTANILVERIESKRQEKHFSKCAVHGKTFKHADILIMASALDIPGEQVICPKCLTEYTLLGVLNRIDHSSPLNEILGRLGREGWEQAQDRYDQVKRGRTPEDLNKPRQYNPYGGF